LGLRSGKVGERHDGAAVLDAHIGDEVDHSPAGAHKGKCFEERTADCYLAAEANGQTGDPRALGRAVVDLSGRNRRVAGEAGEGEDFAVVVRVPGHHYSVRRSNRDPKGSGGPAEIDGLFASANETAIET